MHDTAVGRRFYGVRASSNARGMRVAGDRGRVDTGQTRRATASSVGFGGTKPGAARIATIGWPRCGMIRFNNCHFVTLQDVRKPEPNLQEEQE